MDKKISYEGVVEVLRKLEEEEECSLIDVFVNSAKVGNLEVCQACIDAGVCINNGMKDFEPVLPVLTSSKLAKEKGISTDVWDWLIDKKGVNINSVNVEGFTLLNIACQAGAFENAKYFISKKGAKITTYKESSNWSDLFLATKSGNYDLVKYLIKEKKVDLEADLDYEINPYVASTGKIVELFLSEGADPNLWDGIVLEEAVEDNDLEKVFWLLEYKADVNIKVSPYYSQQYGAVTLMDIATFNGDKAMEDTLCRYGVKSSSKEERLYALVDSSFSDSDDSDDKEDAIAFIEAGLPDDAEEAIRRMLIFSSINDRTEYVIKKILRS